MTSKHLTLVLAGNQETLHFPPTEIVDAGVPVRVKSLLRVGMLKQRRAVEPRQSVGIGWKMCRHPIEDHADARAMARIDEPAKALWGAETA